MLLNACTRAGQQSAAAAACAASAALCAFQPLSSLILARISDTEADSLCKFSRFSRFHCCYMKACTRADLQSADVLPELPQLP